MRQTMQGWVKRGYGVGSMCKGRTLDEETRSVCWESALQSVADAINLASSLLIVTKHQS